MLLSGASYKRGDAMEGTRWLLNIEKRSEGDIVITVFGTARLRLVWLLSVMAAGFGYVYKYYM